METYTVTEEGRLIRHTQGYVKDASCPGEFSTLAPRDIDLEFHGDIVLTGYQNNTQADYVLRFTHGTLEWIEPIESLSEEQQDIAMTRSLSG